MIGYHEEDEKLESTEAYLTYVSAYVKLYAAIIQVFPHFLLGMSIFVGIA